MRFKRGILVLYIFSKSSDIFDQLFSRSGELGAVGSIRSFRPQDPRKYGQKGERDCDGPVHPEPMGYNGGVCFRFPVKDGYIEKRGDECPWQEGDRYNCQGFHSGRVFLCGRSQRTGVFCHRDTDTGLSQSDQVKYLPASSFSIIYFSEAKFLKIRLKGCKYYKVKAHTT